MAGSISVITVNYNGLELTAALIDSLHRCVRTPLEIVVVDNGSRCDETVELQRRYPTIRAIRSEQNLGFAGGNNIGMRVATGDYLLLLNNDTEVEDDTLHYLAAMLDAHAEVGAVCPKIRFFAPPRAIQFAGYTPLTSITLRNALVGFGAEDDGSFDASYLTPYAHGAAMMIRRELLTTAGYMPECYFLYYEELDWSERIRERGYTIAYDPRCTVFHKESATTGRQSPLRTFYLTRNRLLFAVRNRRGAARVLAILYQVFVAAPKCAAVSLFRGQPTLAMAVVRGVWAFWRIKNKMI
ncbi:MAG: glycosyltransferase family 2 protein [Alistipes sp.]